MIKVKIIQQESNVEFSHMSSNDQNVLFEKKVNEFLAFLGDGTGRVYKIEHSIYGNYGLQKVAIYYFE